MFDDTVIVLHIFPKYQLYLTTGLLADEGASQELGLLQNLKNLIRASCFCFYSEIA